MNAPLPVLLVTHHDLGRGLLAAAESILGSIEGVELLSNLGVAPEILERRIADWVDAHPGPVLILADIGFGSCCQAARRVSRDLDRVGILAGVNLPVLLAVLRSHEVDDLRALMRHLAERARGSVEAYLGSGPA